MANEPVPLSKLPRELRELNEQADANVDAALAVMLARYEALTGSYDAIDAKAVQVFSIFFAAAAILIGSLFVRDDFDIFHWVFLSAQATLVVGMTAAAYHVLLARVVKTPPEPAEVMAQLDVARAPRAWLATIRLATEESKPILESKARSYYAMLVLLTVEMMFLLIAAALAPVA